MHCWGQIDAFLWYNTITSNINQSVKSSSDNSKLHSLKFYSKSNLL